MKRVFIGLMVLVLCLAGSALAATPRPPKSLIAQLSGHPPDYCLILAIKKTASVKLGSGAQNIYAINGEWLRGPASNSIPVTGTGHMAADQFHFSLTGSDLFPYTDGSQLLTFNAQGFWDVALQTGSIVRAYTYYSQLGGVSTLGDWQRFDLIPATTLPNIPYDAQPSSAPSPDNAP
jgi:hypothetical protein